MIMKVSPYVEIYIRKREGNYNDVAVAVVRNLYQYIRGPFLQRNTESEQKASVCTSKVLKDSEN